MINKDTKIYGSFSQTPGNNGCVFFNNKFKEEGVNAIYKSFYSNNILQSIKAAKTLNFSGFAVSMPFKTYILDYLDKKDISVKEIGACNTVLIKDGQLIGFNTDWKGVYGYLKDINLNTITILGNGGFSKAVQYACNKLNITFDLITRENWDEIPTTYNTIFNASPVDIKNKEHLIDGRPFTEEGKIISKLQAMEQYKLYTRNEVS